MFGWILQNKTWPNQVAAAMTRGLACYHFLHCPFALSGQGLKRHRDTLISRSLHPLLDGPVSNQYLDLPTLPSTVRKWSGGVGCNKSKNRISPSGGVTCAAVQQENARILVRLVGGDEQLVPKNGRPEAH